MHASNIGVVGIRVYWVFRGTRETQRSRLAGVVGVVQLADTGSDVVEGRGDDMSNGARFVSKAQSSLSANDKSVIMNWRVILVPPDGGPTDIDVAEIVEKDG